jgi:hypothetical protein
MTISKNINKNYFNKKMHSFLHNILFSSQLMNVPNKLECYIALGWKASQDQTLHLIKPSQEENKVL